ncbi:hypothetical protein [Ideonella sp. A 288]|uniref:hypothetical protein n=1 Tax=Ideonella sp. A 288 TaxID=1962181 RepID=UPI000B4B250F|nr:hypothetical protein [Ideonella sp. A 288]
MSTVLVERQQQSDLTLQAEANLYEDPVLDILGDEPAVAPVPSAPPLPVLVPSIGGHPIAPPRPAAAAMPPIPAPARAVAPAVCQEDPNDPLRVTVVDRQGRVRYLRFANPADVARDRAHHVQYLADRSPYAVDLKQVISWRGERLDTYRERQRYPAIGFAPRGHPLSDAQRKLWGSSTMIWVCAPDQVTGDARFYTNVCLLNRFHHSSFRQGGGVIGAGEWIVSDGKLLKISGLSGHYQPPMDFLFRAVLHMSPAFNEDTTVLLYDTVEQRWIDLPVREFIHAPTGGGRYKVFGG